MSLPVRRRQSAPARHGLLGYDPFEEFDQLHRKMGELFDRAWREPTWSDGAFVPAADVEETDEAFLVEIELPGVDRKDIDIELAGRQLSVSGERKEKERTGVLRRRTRTVGRFLYQVVFPLEVAEDEVEADYHDGVLHVTAPKVAGERARKIRVGGRSGGAARRPHHHQRSRWTTSSKGRRSGASTGRRGMSAG